MTTSSVVNFRIQFITVIISVSMIEERIQSAVSPVEIGGLKFRNRVMFGAGTVKTVEQVKQAVKSRASAITVGSITVDSRVGNPGVVYDDNGFFSLNSIGLKNDGAKFYYKDNLPEMVKIAHTAGMQLIVNTSGVASLDDYRIMAEIIAESGADGQEINFACPNVWEDKKDDDDDRKAVTQKRIVSFVPDMVGEGLRIVEAAVGDKLWTSVKVSPYSDPDLLNEVAGVISSFDFVRAVVTSNTFPNAFAFDEDAGQPWITFGKGLAGMAGNALRPIVMGQVIQWREALSSDKAIIAVGGIAHRQHVEDYLRVGADATQITSAFHRGGNAAFGRALSDKYLRPRTIVAA